MQHSLYKCNTIICVYVLHVATHYQPITRLYNCPNCTHFKTTNPSTLMHLSHVIISKVCLVQYQYLRVPLHQVVEFGISARERDMLPVKGIVFTPCKN